MTHTVHPYAHRIGILRDWKSRWFSMPGRYKMLLRGDIILRAYLEKRLKGLHVSAIEIERDGKSLKVIIKTARPGMVIGRQGEGTQKIKAEIEKLARKHKIHEGDIRLEVEEVRFPESNARIVAQMIAEALERRLPFRRVLKQTMDKVMANKNVHGARIALSGRLGGAEMSRSEDLRKGRLPLQTLRADVDFARETAHLPYGTIGVKVWIFKGEIFEDKK